MIETGNDESATIQQTTHTEWSKFCKHYPTSQQDTQLFLFFRQVEKIKGISFVITQWLFPLHKEA